MKVRSWASSEEEADRVRRVTLDLAAEDHRALRLASVEDEIPMAETLRGLVALWRCDADLRKKVIGVVQGTVELSDPT